jgi:hypothetical protein
MVDNSCELIAPPGCYVVAVFEARLLAHAGHVVATLNDTCFAQPLQPLATHTLLCTGVLITVKMLHRFS